MAIPIATSLLFIPIHTAVWAGAPGYPILASTSISCVLEVESGVAFFFQMLGRYGISPNPQKEVTGLGAEQETLMDGKNI